MALERKGIPTATFFTDAFASYAKGLCRMQGMEQLPSIVIPHPVTARPAEEVRGKVQKVYPEVRKALLIDDTKRR